jgi:hypothetical protein
MAVPSFGAKWTGINYMKRNENYRAGEKFTRGRLGISCQKFLQIVKPVRRGFGQNNLKTYLPKNFRL